LIGQRRRAALTAAWSRPFPIDHLAQHMSPLHTYRHGHLYAEAFWHSLCDSVRLLCMFVALCYTFAMSDVLYARAAPDLKSAVDAFAEARNLSLNAAIVDLVTRGLASAADEEDTRRTMEKLELERTKLAKQLAAQENQQQNVAAFVEQAKSTAGDCPKCKKAVTGLDLLRSRCPECGTALSSLPAMKQPLDAQLLLLIGAVGLLAGAAVWAAKK
jgi:hypothetical protein